MNKSLKGQFVFVSDLNIKLNVDFSGGSVLIIENEVGFYFQYRVCMCGGGGPLSYFL